MWILCRQLALELEVPREMTIRVWMLRRCFRCKCVCDAMKDRYVGCQFPLNYTAILSITAHPVTGVLLLSILLWPFECGCSTTSVEGIEETSFNIAFTWFDSVYLVIQQPTSHMWQWLLSAALLLTFIVCSLISRDCMVSFVDIAGFRPG